MMNKRLMLDKPVKMNKMLNKPMIKKIMKKMIKKTIIIKTIITKTIIIKTVITKTIIIYDADYAGEFQKASFHFFKIKY